jgi:fluoride exporter
MNCRAEKNRFVIGRGTMDKLLINSLAVGAAGFFGAVARYLVVIACGRWFTTAFPVGTLIVNLSGSFVLGWFAALAATRANFSEPLRLAVATGFVGAYTTFSTFALESDQLLRHSPWLAALNLVGSVVLGLLAVRLGMWCAGAL